MPRSSTDFAFSTRSVFGVALLILGVWYAALVGIHLRSVAPPASWWIAGAAAVTALVFFGCGLHWLRHRPSEALVDLYVFWASAVILANDALYLFFFPEPQYLDGLTILMVGGALFLTSSRWFGLLTGAISAVALAVLVRSGASAQWTQPGILFTTGSFFAVIVHLWRRAYLRHVDFLHVQSEEQRRELERTVADLARHQNDLQALVEERTRELLGSRERLRESDRLAAVGTLTAGIAHQINNPIGAILVGAEFALASEDEDDVDAIRRNVLTSNLEEAQRCASIVQNMLRFTRNEPTEKWIEDLNQVVQRAKRATTAYARDRSGEVVLNLSETSLPVLMSPIEIEQVLVNVIRNGIESMEDDVRVEIRTWKEGAWASIALLDRGRGIDAQQIGRVFDPFYSSRVREGGTGLGLSVAQGIVIDHGGKIHVDSEKGAGTTVSIRLPLSAPSES